MGTLEKDIGEEESESMESVRPSMIVERREREREDVRSAVAQW